MLRVLWNYFDIIKYGNINVTTVPYSFCSDEFCTGSKFYMENELFALFLLEKNSAEWILHDDNIFTLIMEQNDASHIGEYFFFMYVHEKTETFQLTHI